ncbi:MAG: SRPBCC domain-containing protein [Gaiellales bacterium]
MEIEREIVVPATREEAWSALTDPDELREWYANDVELEPEPGGEVAFRWESGEERHGVVEEIEELERVVLRFDDDGVVELRLEDVDGGTLVHVRESAPSFGVAVELLAQAAWAIA